MLFTGHRKQFLDQLERPDIKEQFQTRLKVTADLSLDSIFGRYSQDACDKSKFYHNLNGIHDPTSDSFFNQSMHASFFVERFNQLYDVILLCGTPKNKNSAARSSCA